MLCDGDPRDGVSCVMVIRVIVCLFEGDPREGESDHEPGLPDPGQQVQSQGPVLVSGDPDHPCGHYQGEHHAVRL